MSYIDLVLPFYLLFPIGLTIYWGGRMEETAVAGDARETRTGPTERKCLCQGN